MRGFIDDALFAAGLSFATQPLVWVAVLFAVALLGIPRKLSEVLI